MNFWSFASTFVFADGKPVAVARTLPFPNPARHRVVVRDGHRGTFMSSGTSTVLSQQTQRRLDEVRGTAPPRSPTVRALAAYAGLSACPLATLGFSASVDFDRLLDGTRYKMPFGQSPFAIARGRKFEERLRADGYAALLALLGELAGFPSSGARVENLRTRSPMPERAEQTLRQL